MMSLRTFACFLFAACLMRHASCITVSQLKREVLDKILPKNENDVFVAPENNTGDVTQVETSAHVLHIESINEKDMEFTMVIYFRQSWRDHRLRYTGNALFDYVTINDDNVIWTPDTFFTGMKQGHDFDTVRPNVYIKIYPDGLVVFSKKLSVTVACPMDLSRFPFDKQHCTLHMESYGHTTDSLLMKWKKHSAFTIGDTVMMRLFQLDKMVSYSGSVSLPTAIYSYLGVDFYFTRQLSFYVHQIFLPSIVMVGLSRLPFWLKNQALVAKLMIGLGILITYTVTIFKFHSNQIKTSCITSMHYFSWMCLGFLASSLLETVLIHALSKENEAVKECLETEKVRPSKKKVNFVVLTSRYVMPAMFALMCVVYFGTGGFRSDKVIEVWRNNATEIIVNKS